MTQARFDDPRPSVRVWDPLVRLFHWSLVGFVGIELVFEAGTDLHLWAGYAILGLLAVRIVWGFVGSRHARFVDFVRGPAATLSHLREVAQGRDPRTLGHNPAGAAMILALILVIGLTGATGALMTQDAWWGYEPLEEAHEILANLVILLVGLHLAGVVVTGLMHRENLVLAMITGRKRPLTPQEDPASARLD